MPTGKPSPKTLAEIAASRPEADLARIDATTEEQIAFYEREDGDSGFDMKAYSDEMGGES